MALVLLTFDLPVRYGSDAAQEAITEARRSKEVALTRNFMEERGEIYGRIG